MGFADEIPQKRRKCEKRLEKSAKNVIFIVYLQPKKSNNDHAFDHRSKQRIKDIDDNENNDDSCPNKTVRAENNCS